MPGQVGYTYTNTEFSGLTAGVAYRGSVIATYADTGDTAPAFGDVEIALKALGPVNDLKVRPGNRSIAVSWRAPRADALTTSIRGYYVDLRATKGSWKKSKVVDVPGTSALFRGLVNGTTYVVTVQASTTQGGAVVTRRATPLGVPAAVSSLALRWKAGGKARLRWTAARSSKDKPVSGYKVYVNGTKVKGIAGRTSTRCVVKGLKRGRTYTVAVRSRNAVWTSSPVRLVVTRP